jgi:hypothetical protein
MAIWYILWSFGIFFPFLACCAEKNLATLVQKVLSTLQKVFLFCFSFNVDFGAFSESTVKMSKPKLCGQEF